MYRDPQAAGSRQVTVIGHWESILDGFVEGATNPAGQGTGATSIATNLTDTANKDRENDLSDTFVSLGLVGGLLYVAIIILLFRTVLLATSVIAMLSRLRSPACSS